MREEKSDKRSAETTRERILAAALTRFARASYEEVRLRDIAADVGVDVALVHRSFGSKDQLFAAVIAAASPAELLASERGDLCTVFAKRGLAPRQDECLQIFVRSLASPLARDLLRAHCLRDFIQPLSAKLDGPAAQQRATLFVAGVIGVSILRDILEVELLCDSSNAAGQQLIERMLASCLGDGPPNHSAAD